MEDELVAQFDFIPSTLLSYCFFFSTVGATVRSASLSSSSSTSVSLEFTFYKPLASLVGEHGEYFVHELIQAP